MGRETKNFRQTRRSGTADYSAKSYARINRQGSFGRRLDYGTSKKRGNIT